MRYTEEEFVKQFGVNLSTPQNQELFLKSNAKGAFDLSIIALYMEALRKDSGAVFILARLRNAKICS